MEDLMMKTILESMGDSLIVIDPQGDVVYANRATETVLGCDLGALRRDGVGVTFFANEINYDFNQVIVDAIQRKSVQDYREVDYHHPDGLLKRLAATTSYVIDRNGPHERFIGFMAIFKDITELFTLRRRDKDLMEQKQRVLTEKTRTLQKLAAGVAHEILNPVVSIGGFAVRLNKMNDVPNSVRENAGRILEGARRLEDLVEKVQAYCDIAAPNPVPTDVIEVIKRAMSHVAPAAGLKGITVRLSQDAPDTMESRLDSRLLETAIVCLLQNAVDFSEEGLSAEITLDATSEELAIQIKDQGEGISPKDMDYIFDPFFSTRADRPGMGLAVARRIVLGHMGRLDVESSRGKGACVRLRLPLSLAP